MTSKPANPARERMAQTAMKIFAVDVDGVLNALSRPGSQPPRGWEDRKVRAFRIRFNPSHGAKLAAVAAEHDAELVWCTTWEEMAPELIAPLVGLPPMPWVQMEPGLPSFRDRYTTSIGCTKAKAMAAYAGDRPFCWLDDEPDAASELRSHAVPHMVIRVDGRSGLQDHHLRKASAWFTELAKTRLETRP